MARTRHGDPRVGYILNLPDSLNSGGTLTFWSFVWGAGGALLAVPMTVLMVAVFARTPALEPIALMISNMKSHAELQEALHQSDQTLAEGADDWDEWDDEPSEQKA